jgi:polyferredoxin
MLTSKEQGNGQDTVQSGQRPGMHLAEAVKAYGRIELELIKLQAVQAATRVLAMMALRVAVIALSFLFVLLMSMGVGLLIGDMLGKPHYGLLIVALFYLLLIVIVSFVLGGWIRRQAGNAIMKALLK